MSGSSVRARPPFAPALAVMACMAAGLALGRYMPAAPSGAWFACASSGCAVAILVRGRAARAALAAAAVAFGAGWFTLRIVEPPAGSLRAILPGSPVTVELEGLILDAPTGEQARAAIGPWLVPGEPRWRTRLAASAIHAGADRRPVSGLVHVLAPARVAAELGAGRRVRVVGTMSPVAARANPGEADRRLWAAQSGLAGTIRVATVEAVEDTDPAAWLAGRWAGWRAGLKARADRVLLGPPAEGGASPGRAMLAALVLGEREGPIDEVQGAFTRLGLAHVLAISGFHMAVMAGVMLALVRLTGDRGVLEPLAAGVAVAIYLAIVPANAPVLRSGVMFLALLAAEAAGRRYHPIAVLAWTATGVLLARPMDLWSIGFQLSFGLAALLAWLGPTAFERLWGRPLIGASAGRTPPAAVSAVVGSIKRLISSSLLCWAAATPLVAYHTGLVSPAAVVTSVVVVPAVTVLLISSYVLLAVGMASPELAGALQPAVSAVSELIAALVLRLDGAPWASWTIPAVSLAWAVFATTVVIHWFRRGHRRDAAAWAGTVIAAAWVVAEVALGPRLPGGVALRIDTLAVGDGTCHLLRSGRDALLWDCGGSSPLVGTHTAPRAVRALGAWRVRTAVVTHANFDHYGGLADAAERLGIRRVILGDAFIAQAEADPGGPVGAAVAALRAGGVELTTAAAGDAFDLGHARVEFLSPPAGPPWPIVNDRSLVALVTVATDAGDRRLLLTGDVQDRALAYLVSEHPGLRADVLELPHHGSFRESAAQLVVRSDPRVVLQSTGPSRVGDDRWAPLRDRMRWLVTAADGAAWAEIGRDGLVRSGSLRSGGR